ncbi:MAG TPA: rhodanese-like domain-containing protein [Planctomycetota bacterium]|nr:rhodanese-like domain-containing protein [Planctomycetota bacterium]
MQTIPVARAVKLINQWGGATLLAVLDEQAFAADHIPGSLRFEVGDDAQCARVLHALRGRPRSRIILYSASSGPEAYQAAEWLEECGFGPVSVLNGGMEAWDAAGYALASDLAKDRLTVTQTEQDQDLLAAGVPFVERR